VSSTRRETTSAGGPARRRYRRKPWRVDSFGDADAVGRHIAMNRADASGQNRAGAIEVVGVIRSPREETFEENAPARIYRPLGQVGATNTYLNVELAPGVSESEMIARLRRELRAIEPDNPVLMLRPLSDFPLRNINSASVAFGAVLVAACAAVAFALAVVGVLQREGLRGGAPHAGDRDPHGAWRAAAEVYRLVLTQGALQAAGRYRGWRAARGGRGKGGGSALLYRVSPYDWGLLLLTSALIAIAALLACFVPARRATKVDPVVALRCE
jgi:putative ABC transport system permease protein